MDYRNKKARQSRAEGKALCKAENCLRCLLSKVRTYYFLVEIPNSRYNGQKDIAEVKSIITPNIPLIIAGIIISKFKNKNAATLKSTKPTIVLTIRSKDPILVFVLFSKFIFLVKLMH